MKSIYNIALLGVSLGALATPHLAFAQTAKPAAEEAAADDADIVVIGTLIRGTAAVGSQTLSVDAAAIADTGATSTNELLGLIPQIGSTFNGRFEGDPRGFSAGISINKPNLRNFPSSNTTSGGLTLVLVDGSRIAPVGVNQAGIDVDVIPAAVLEGIDAVTDGGSSLYGADAVGGVLNFRTLRKFEGIKLDGNYGFGTTIKGFHEWDASITVGKSWATGNAYISAGRSDRDGILNGETSFSNGFVYNAAGVRSQSFTQCPSAVGTETRWFRFGPGAAQFTSNPRAPGAGEFAVGTPCSRTEAESYLPAQKRTNVYAAISQEIGNNADLRVTGYWTKRDTELAVFPRGVTAAGSPLNTGALVGAAFPTAAIGSITAVPGGTSFSFGVNPAYEDRPTRIGFETYGVTPELTVKLGSNWQVRTTAHYGRSTNFQAFAGVNTVAAQAAINAGLLNPRNAAAASASVVTNILNFENRQETKQELFILRSVADGTLFELPSGDVKLAVGLEYQRNKAESRQSTGTIGSVSALPYKSFSRNAKSAFAELSVPLTSFADLSGSVRYDKYSDFGSTTNPNIGLTIKPVSWFRVFGHWNTAYNAPTAVDGLGIGNGRYVCGIYVPNSVNAAQRPTDPLGRDTSRQGSCALVLQGSSPTPLKPQTAKSWAIGFEATPSSHVRFGGEFYSISAKNTLGSLNPSNVNTYVTNPNLYTYNVTASQFSTLLAQLVNGGTLGAQQVFSDVAIIVDTRISNLNSTKIQGVDFHVNFNTDTDLGHFDAGINGTVQTKAFQVNGGVATDELSHGSAPLLASAYLGWNKSGFSTKVTLNYTGPFNDVGFDNVGVSEKVTSFLVTNLKLGYDFKDSGGALSGLALRLTVDNLFETTPQSIRRANTNNLSYNNFTLGRVIKLGASLKF
jgi:iron complex outermembrane recepter protein